MPPDIIDEQFAALAESAQRRFGQTPTLQRNPDGTATVIVPGFKLEAGWSRSEATVYFLVPVGYPVARPDTFWTDQLRLANGSPPASTGDNHTHQTGRTGLTWFSYHPSVWNANRDNLLTYLAIIGNRLKEVR